MGGQFINQRITPVGRNVQKRALAIRPVGLKLARGALLLSWIILPLTAGQGAAADGTVGVRPAEIKPSEMKPAEIKSGETKPTENEPSARDAASSPSVPRTDTIARHPEVQTPGPKGGVPSTEPSPSVTAERKNDARTAAREANDAKNLSVPQRALPADVAQKIGHKIWLNEAGGRRDAITSWNAGEEFASLGIGHFIWYPAAAKPPYEEGFPGLVAFLRKGKTPLPSWLDKTPIPPCPWTSRADFKRNFNSAQMRQLRKFLLDTMAEQAQFLVARAQGAMDKILANTPDGAERKHIVAQYSRVVRASEDLYPLIDYINFKGEGTNPSETAVDKETGQRQGWGLKQVLLKMDGTTTEPKAVLAEYSDAVQVVLQQRVRNLPSNRVWEAGWLRRAETYRRPIAQLEQAPERAPRRSSRYRADNAPF